MSCQPSGLVFLSGSTRLSYSRVVYPIFWSSVKVDYADPMPSVRLSVPYASVCGSIYEACNDDPLYLCRSHLRLDSICAGQQRGGTGGRA